MRHAGIDWRASSAALNGFTEKTPRFGRSEMKQLAKVGYFGRNGDYFSVQQRVWIEGKPFDLKSRSSIVEVDTFVV